MFIIYSSHDQWLYPHWAPLSKACRTHPLPPRWISCGKGASFGNRKKAQHHEEFRDQIIRDYSWLFWSGKKMRFLLRFLLRWCPGSSHQPSHVKHCPLKLFHTCDCEFRLHATSHSWATSVLLSEMHVLELIKIWGVTVKLFCGHLVK